MSEENGWVKVAEAADVMTRPMKAVYPKGVPVLIIAKGDDIFAMSNRCPHLGCLLSSGTLKGDTVICPCHGWSFEVRTGELTISKEIRLTVYRTKIENGSVYVKLED